MGKTVSVSGSFLCFFKRHVSKFFFLSKKTALYDVVYLANTKANEKFGV